MIILKHDLFSFFSERRQGLNWCKENDKRAVGTRYHIHSSSYYWNTVIFRGNHVTQSNDAISCTLAEGYFKTKAKYFSIRADQSLFFCLLIAKPIQMEVHTQEDKRCCHYLNLCFCCCCCCCCLL